MTFRTLIRRSLRFHWRSHLGVVLGAAIGSAALIGALVVGDSVKGSLRDRSLERLGQVHFALSAHDRFFSDEWGQRIYALSNYHAGFAIAPNEQAGFLHPQPVTALILPGTASAAHGAARANHIQVLGISLYPKFDPHGKWLGDFAQVEPGEVWLNEALAQQLRVNLGDTVLIRVARPAALAADAAISQRTDQGRALSLKLSRIVARTNLGNFSLLASPKPSFNAFVNLRAWQQQLDLPDRANQLLASGTWRQPANDDGTSHSAPFSYERWRNNLAAHSPEWLADLIWRSSGSSSITLPEADPATAAAALQTALAHSWKLEDTQAILRPANPSPQLELVSKRVFLDHHLARSAQQTGLSTRPLLTYLATQLRAGTNRTPYSMVTAAGAPWTPADLRDDEIVVSQWLADDLRVQPGDEIALSYFLPESGAKLAEATNSFRVHSIVPMALPWADRTLMPDFPGIEKAESTSEWDAGFPLTYEIRKQDDDYWRQYRGTPKAFLTLATGQKLWGNRFGNLTALRFPQPATSTTTNFPAELEKRILTGLKPEELGLRFEPVQAQALKAAAESQDFGGLFLGFSCFVILAALILMALLFQFGLEQRTTEIGTLLALGFTPKRVGQLFLREGAMLALFGGILGAGGGIYFAKAMLLGLTTIWRDAVSNTNLTFHITGLTLAIGLFASVLVSTLTLWLALRKFVKRTPQELLAGETTTPETKVRSHRSKVIGGAALVLGWGLVSWAILKGDTQSAGIFFGAGALVLVAGLSFTNTWLAQMSNNPAPGTPISRWSLALRGCARRRRRSLATIAMLASGSFLIVSIGVFRLDANREATQKTSGTGGFALLGETTLPVVQDLNAASGRDFFALNERDLEGVNIVPFRVRGGDEASCLNLSRAQKPRLLGIKPESLAGRFTFTKLVDHGFDEKPWETLKEFYPKNDQPLATNEIAAIGDANSIQWAMGKKVGDTIDYVDERGQPFKVRIVGAVANSILQGQLLIAETEFVKHFPGESGYRMFLIDAPSNTVSQVSATLSRAMQDMGLELTPTTTRLSQFNAVQNTYLGTFQILGGLGLLLGSVGLGIVVLRNVLERRSELAILLAVGFTKPQVQRLLLLENGALLGSGLAIGLIAAGSVVLPTLLAPAAHLPMLSFAITLSAVSLNGALWTWAATRYAVRGDLLPALRNE